MGYRRRLLLTAPVSILFVIATLAGCTPQPGATSTPTAAPTTPPTTETPSPTPPPPADAVIAFDGDCNSMLSVQQVAMWLGPASAEATWADDYPPSKLSGQLACTWKGEARSLTVEAIPRQSVPADVVNRYIEPICEDSGYFCGGAAEVGDLWMLANFGASPDDGDWRSDVVEVLEALTLSGEAHPEAAPAQRGDSWWTPPDCAAIGERIDVASILGVESVEPVFPGDAIPQGPSWESLVQAQLDAWCPWTSYAEPLLIVEAQVWPGSADVAAERLAVQGARSASVEGADRAVITPGLSEGQTYLFCVVGPNVLWVYSSTVGEESLVDLAEAILPLLA